MDTYKYIHTILVVMYQNNSTILHDKYIRTGKVIVNVAVVMDCEYSTRC